MRNFGGQPRRARIFHRASLLTVSKALVRSMAENGEELWRAAKTLRDFPQSLPAYCIKVLGQVDESYEWAHVLFPALLLDLAEYEDHVCCPSVGPEATLALWCVLLGAPRPCQLWRGE